MLKILNKIFAGLLLITESINTTTQDDSMKYQLDYQDNYGKPKRPKPNPNSR